MVAVRAALAPLEAGLSRDKAAGASRTAAIVECLQVGGWVSGLDFEAACLGRLQVCPRPEGTNQGLGGIT